MSEPIIDLLANEWASIAALIDPLTDEQWDLPTALPGWSVRDNVTHMIGTESMLLGEPVPDVPVAHLPHVRDDFAAIGETWIEQRRGHSGEQVKQEFAEVTRRRLDALRAMSPEDFDTPGWSPIGEVPYRAFMGVRVFDCWMHEQDIRRAIGQPGHVSGPVVDKALERFASALPYAVGKKAGAPDGSSVVLDVRGATQRRYPIVVDGRAKLVTADDEPAEPTVEISLPFDTFVALGGGRWHLDEAMAAGGVEITGDRALGEQVLDHLGFTP